MADEPDEKRPVKVTEENRPPGDPGPDVDIQELVGGQPGVEDPGLTGGPSREEVGAREEPGAPSREDVPEFDEEGRRPARSRERDEDAPRDGA